MGQARGPPAAGARLSYGTVADDFAYLARTPAKAAKQALDKIGKAPEDVDLWEINEAFASVAINSVRMLGVDEDKVNVNGGAIALGHPIGASGARIVGALVHELRRRGGGIGCAAICSGGGQGDAIVLEVNGVLGATSSLRSVSRVAAFFDLDRTLMAGSSGMHFARAAYRSGMVSRARLARWGVEHVRFRLRGSTDERTAQVLTQVKELLAGVPERNIERMGPDLLAGVLPRIYPKMLEEVRAHQDAGRATFIVSAAGNGLVEMLARVLGMDGGIGTRYEVASGRPADRADRGAVRVRRRQGGRHEALRRRARHRPGESWAYSDSASDLPMLRAVGNPVAVNPDAELARLAAEEGWRVMRFEKLGRRLAIGGATLAAAASGTLLATRHRQSARRLRARSSRRRR